MTCAALGAGNGSSIAASLRAVDCQSAEATAVAFSRLFGSHGGLTAALTTLLTLYVGLLALGFLTGRTRLGLSTLTPRMMGLGLALTFATSWVAYQNVVWSLLTGGPDQIAGLLLGVKGSASQAFADRLDIAFSAVADAADRAHAGQGEMKGATPGDMLSYAALLLLLGTVGVLVTARIALAALLAAGPVFIVMALFSGTRGLFEGWARATVMFALVPLFTVLLGIGSISMLGPVLSDLSSAETDLRQATIVFVAAVIHCALMLLVLRLVATLVSDWRSLAQGRPHGRNPVEPPAPAPAFVQSAGHAGLHGPAAAPAGPDRDERIRALVVASSGATADSLARRIAPGGAVPALAPLPPAMGGAENRASEITRRLRGGAHAAPLSLADKKAPLP